ncbi:MAG TPA: MarR family winged helix-turn-helix transcriptional regulator [Dehalococcoidia bacterium]|nr:MarR family winged helix-turn-helix transcriptional regulator [Dehalococcoidia bacterium]
MERDLRLMLSRATRTLTRYFGDRAAEMDLSVVQAQALLVLDANPGMNLGALAKSLSKDQASTSIMIDKMMSLGLVRRDTDPGDRRRALLYVAPQAETHVERLEGVRQDINRLVIDALGPERSQTLETLLVQMLDAIENHEE